MITKNILNIFLPPRCVMCKEIVISDNTLCFECWPKITPFENFDFVSSGILYDKNSSSIFLRFKYHDECYLSDFFAKWMVLNVPKDFLKADIITGVPLHWRRLFFRMYNQANLLVMSVLKLININKPVFIPDLLKRTRHTKVQDKNRKENVKNAFISTKNLYGKTVLLIDDVYASGATVNECKKSLKKAQASKVYILTAGRSLKENSDSIL